MDLVNDNHQENIIKMSAETIMDVLVHIYNIERKCSRPFPPHQQMKKFEFIFKWLQKNMFSIKEETKQRILSYINLESFTIKQLLGKVRDSNLFELEDILKAIIRKDYFIIIIDKY